jgi:hypothetical protein
VFWAVFRLGIALKSIAYCRPVTPEVAGSSPVTLAIKLSNCFVAIYLKLGKPARGEKHGGVDGR